MDTDDLLTRADFLLRAWKAARSREESEELSWKVDEWCGDYAAAQPPDTKRSG